MINYNAGVNNGFQPLNLKNDEPETELPREQKEDDQSGSSAVSRLVDAAYEGLKDVKLPASVQAVLSSLPSLDIFGAEAGFGFGGSDSGKHLSPVEKDHSPGAKQRAEADLWGAKPDTAVCPDACQQPPDVGNCYFVAAMASLAKMNPQAIKDMIKTNDDGTYTVKFPGIDQPITVGKPTAEEIARVGGKSEHGTWPLILMKAYGAYHGGGARGDLDGGDGGSAFSAGIRALTKGEQFLSGVGKRTEMHSASGWDQILSDAMKNKQVVVICTDKSPFSSATRDNYYRGHAYSVLDYKPNPANPEQGMITIRNPHMGSKPMTISVQEFKANFGQVSIAKR